MCNKVYIVKLPLVFTHHFLLASRQLAKGIGLGRVGTGVVVEVVEEVRGSVVRVVVVVVLVVVVIAGVEDKLGGPVILEEKGTGQPTRIASVKLQKPICISKCDLRALLKYKAFIIACFWF